MTKFRIAVGSRGPHTTILSDLLSARGWTPTGGLDWSLYWDVGVPDEGVFRAAGARRRLNHVYGSGVLTNKAALHRTLSWARERLARVGAPDMLGWAPRTFVMPDDFDAWRTAAAWEPDTWWIRKPAALSRGRGIALVERVSDVTPEPDWVVQEYFSAPHLLDGRKYTLRLYVVITSLFPLRVCVHRDGFAKLASRPFSNAPAARADRFAHLTNPDVLSEDTDTPVSSANLTLEAYRRRMAAEGVDVDALWQRIRAVVAGAMLAGCGPMRSAAADAQIPTEGCFQLLGLDVLVDAHLQPHLIECNLGPSLAVEADASTPASRDERDVKERVVADLLQVTGLLADDVDPSATRFETLIPSADVVSLLPCCDAVDDADLHAWAEVCDGADAWRPLAARGVSHEAAGDELMLFVARTGEFITLDPVGAAVWLGLSSGADPHTLARELADATGAPVADTALHVWRALANWLLVGMLATPETAMPPLPTVPRAHTLPDVAWNGDPVLQILGRRIAIRGSRDVVADVLGPSLVLAGAASAAGGIDGAIELRVSPDGCAVVSEAGMRVMPCEAVTLAATAIREATRLACRANGAVLASRLTVVDDGVHAVIVLDAHGDFVDAVLSAVSSTAGVCVTRAAQTQVAVGEGRLTVRIGARSPLPVAAIVWVRQSADVDGVTRARASRAVSALVADDRLAVKACDPGGARALVRCVSAAPALVLTAADEAGAARRLAECLRAPGRSASSAPVAPETH